MEERYLVPILTRIASSPFSKLHDLEVRIEHDDIETANALRDILMSSSLSGLNTIQLSFSRFTHAVFHPLAQGFRCSTKVSVVALDQCSFDDESIVLFENMFHGSSGNLKTLQIKGWNHFRKPMVSVLCNCLGPTSCLKELDIAQTYGLSTANVKTVMQALQCSRALECFHIENIDTFEMCKVLADEIPKLQLLQRFRFSIRDSIRNPALSQMLLQVFKQSRSLMEVTYTGHGDFFSPEQEAKLRMYALRNEKLAAMIKCPDVVNARLWPSIICSLKDCHYDAHIIFQSLLALGDVVDQSSRECRKRRRGQGRGSSDD